MFKVFSFRYAFNTKMFTFSSSKKFFAYSSSKFKQARFQISHSPFMSVANTLDNVVLND